MSYGYEGELYVLADVKVAADVPVGTALTEAADVDFLVCAEVCLPASGHVEWKAPVLAQPAPSRFASAIANARAARAGRKRMEHFGVARWFAHCRVGVRTECVGQERSP